MPPPFFAQVWTYRASISVVAASFVGGTALAILADPSSAPAPSEDLGSLLAVFGASGLGIGLSLIHIYVTELKRLLQVFWLLGVLGGVYILIHEPVSLPAYVAEHRGAVWVVGPAFAALTGLTFKEGVCYGKAEAFALTLLVPALLLGHLTGWASPEVEKVLAVGVSGLLTLFAARKYTQPVKDDIGDGSVFVFQKLSAEEQAAFVQKLRDDGEILR